MVEMKMIAALALSAIALMPAEADAKKVKVKLGTLAPEGSPWHNGLKRMTQKWDKISGGNVEVKIYPGGVLGDEGDMVRKMRVGQLHAGTMTGVGLAVISRATYAMQVPMMFSSFEELDYVRKAITPQIQAELESNGVVVLGWGDAGWVHFFSKPPAKTVDDYRKLKMFVWSGDPSAELAWKAANFKAVPMSATDVMSGLQTGLIESFATTPLFALSSQWFTYAKNMTAVKWTPLNGATVMTKDKWNELKEAGDLAAFKAAAEEEVVKTNAEVRALGEKSIKAMADRGLVVHEPSAAELAEWQKAAEAAYPTLREKVIPAKFFDEVQRLVKEHRASKK
jgi:TRAP-type transport system periplasmic protein